MEHTDGINKRFFFKFRIKNVPSVVEVTLNFTGNVKTLRDDTSSYMLREKISLN